MSTHKKAAKKAVSDGIATNHLTTPYEPTIEEIRARAYEVYVERGRLDGFDLENWFQAEEELKVNGSKPTN
jgi:hypothetical protein